MRSQVEELGAKLLQHLRMELGFDVSFGIEEPHIIIYVHRKSDLPRVKEEVGPLPLTVKYIDPVGPAGNEL